ncbi:MAG TPA: hypothetical protein VF364_12445 [Candidatus Limnocylindria bacterium]
MDQFGGISALKPVEVDVLTDSYRISGTVRTRFGRVTDILNQLSSNHLLVEQATIREHADPTATLGAPTAVVDVGSIILLAAPGLNGEASSEMRIPKRAVKAHLAIPPVRVSGTIHVAMGSRPLDGLLNVVDRFLAMTDVTIASGPYPELGRTAAVVAVARAAAQLVLVADDEQPDELLADILDERTAEAWLRADEPSG